MRTASTSQKKKSRKQNPVSSQKGMQGFLLFEKATDKYQAFDDSKRLLDKLNKLFDRKGNHLILSTSDDKIYYFNEFLENAVKILEKL